MYLSYVYFIKHKSSNRFYHGSRCKNVTACRTPEEDLWIHYFTSSKKVAEIINEFGEDDFEISIIFTSNSYDECYWHEQNLIKLYIDSPLSINKTYVDQASGKKCSLWQTEHIQKKLKRNNL